MRLLIRPIVEVDLEDIARRIGADHPESAKRFLLRVAETFELLACLPQLGAGQMIAAYPEARQFFHPAISELRRTVFAAA